jgi:hypothetical protein
MGHDSPIVLDITRPYEVLAICPICLNQRNLPEDWRAIVAPGQPPDWDGQIRCQRGHWPEVMTLTPVRNPARREADGTYVSHLVMDEDRRRAACTGQLWGGLPNDMPPGTRVRLCAACLHASTR